MESTQIRSRVAILSTPGMGHLIPLIGLARKLVHLHNLTVTFIVPDDGSPMKPQKCLLENLHPSINSVFLHPADSQNGLLRKDEKIETRIFSSVTRCLPSLRQALSELSESTRLSAFVVDIMGMPSFELAQELGIPVSVFFPSSAMGLSFCFHLPELDRSCTCEYRDLPEPVKFPGCVPLRGSDLADPVQDRKHEAYKALLDLSKKVTLAEGILVDTFLELEPETFKALEQDGSGTIPPVYPIGPFVRPSPNDEKVECLEWLDKQPRGSVLFVSFGSGGTLSREQLNELAVGLQWSEQRFLLVAKNPDDKARNAGYFADSVTKLNPLEYLPTDFIEGTKEKGFVLSQWAPQIQVLSHPSTGGFLTHCGWNSTLESIVHGVPLIAWPLFAEQRMNAVLLSDDLKVAFRVTENENGFVDSLQISRLVRNLIEGEGGEELRKRMRSSKEGAAKAMSQDGSSTRSLARVAEKWICRGAHDA